MSTGASASSARDVWQLRLICRGGFRRPCWGGARSCSRCVSVARTFPVAGRWNGAPCSMGSSMSCGPVASGGPRPGIRFRQQSVPVLSASGRIGLLRRTVAWTFGLRTDSGHRLGCLSQDGSITKDSVAGLGWGGGRHRLKPSRPWPIGDQAVRLARWLGRADRAGGAGIPPLRSSGLPQPHIS